MIGSAIDIGSRLELFVDDYLIDSMAGMDFAIDPSDSPCAGPCWRGTDVVVGSLDTGTIGYGVDCPQGGGRAYAASFDQVG